MNSVFILNQYLVYSDGFVLNTILGVYPTKEDAQKDLCRHVCMDEQFGCYEHCTTKPELDREGFDLYEAYNELKPIPLDYVHYWDGDDGSGRMLTYQIQEYPVQSFSL